MECDSALRVNSRDAANDHDSHPTVRGHANQVALFQKQLLLTSMIPSLETKGNHKGTRQEFHKPFGPPNNPQYTVLMREGGTICEKVKLQRDREGFRESVRLCFE
jgi:hypothetical protein